MEEEELVQVNMTINIKMAMILNCLGEMKGLNDGNITPQPLFMFMDGVNRVDLRDGEGGSGPLQRAFSASATCLERPLDSQVSCFVFCQQFSSQR